MPRANGPITEFDKESAASSSRGSVGSEDFVTEESEAHHKFNDEAGVNINRRQSHKRNNGSRQIN